MYKIVLHSQFKSELQKKILLRAFNYLYGAIQK